MPVRAMLITMRNQAIVNVPVRTDGAAEKGGNIRPPRIAPGTLVT